MHTYVPLPTPPTPPPQKVRCKDLHTEAPPQGPTPYPFVYHLERKGIPFVYLLLRKGTPCTYLLTIDSRSFSPKTQLLEILEIFSLEMGQISSDLLKKGICNMTACVSFH